MEKRFIELVSKYNLESKYADEAFYVEFFNIAKECLGLENYLSNLIFIKKEEFRDPKYKEYTSGLAGMFCQAAYKKATGEFIVLDGNINYENNMILNGMGLIESDKIAMYNLLVLHTLLHEIEHAKQEKMIKEGNDFESRLITLVNTDTRESSFAYEYSLNERLAEVRSYEQILDAYAELNLYEQRIYEYFLNEYRISALSGYHFEDENGYLINSEEGIFMCPTFKYAILKNADIKEISELCNSVTGDDRFIYGLPVEYEEYKKYKGVIKDHRI